MARKLAKKPVAAAAAEERPVTVVYIHGIGSKPAPDVLKRQWDQALFGVDMGARTRMAYWADIRHPVTETKSLAAGIPEAYRPLSDAERVDESRRLAPYGKDAEAFATGARQTSAAENPPLGQEPRESKPRCCRI